MGYFQIHRRGALRCSGRSHGATAWWRAALMFAALAAACAFASMFDDRTFNGVSVWTKPFKFSMSIAVYFATLAWFAPLLPNGYLQAPRVGGSQPSGLVRRIRNRIHRAPGESRTSFSFQPRESAICGAV